MINFYGVKKDWPLSAANNLPNWNDSKLGRLYAESGGEVYLLEYHKGWNKPELMWRVTDFQWIQEDGIISYFRAFDENGLMCTEATFGVAWDGNTRKIGGGFTFKPEYGNQYYVPVANNFATPNTGGYKVTVLDMANPSETMAFGLKTNGTFGHQGAVITFRLLPVGNTYPNDF